MLLNDLYFIRSLNESEHSLRADVELVASHCIFKGHFPGHPVLPGVCMMEMVTEILGSHKGRPFSISAAPMIKFLLMINPETDPLIVFEINYVPAGEKILAHGKIFSVSRIFMKFNFVLTAM